MDGQKFLLVHQLRSEGQHRAPPETGGRRHATTEHRRLLCDLAAVFPILIQCVIVLVRTEEPSMFEGWRIEERRTRRGRGRIAELKIRN